MIPPARTGEWRRARLSRSNLYVLLIPELIRSSLEEAARAALAGGADLLQLRLKDVSTAERVAAVRRLLPDVEAAGALLVVNDDPEAARLAGADGVHVGDDDPEPPAARRIVGPAALLGRSTHGMEEVLQAIQQPIDYLAIGSIYATATKQPKAVVGPHILRRIQREVPNKTFAIGGITLANLPEVIACGGAAVAVSSAILSADDPVAATRAFKAMLAGAEGAPAI